MAQKIELILGDRVSEEKSSRIITEDYTYFNGTSGQYLSIPSTSAIEFDWLDSFSYSFWFKWEKNLIIFGKTSTSGNNPGYFLQHSPNGSLTWTLQGSNSGENIIVNTEAGSITTSQWHHIVVSYEASSFNAAGTSIWIDGIKMTTTVTSDDLNTNFNNTTELNIASSRAGAIQSMGGSFNHFTIFDKVLSDDEVVSIAEQGLFEVNYTSISNIVAYWDLNILEDIDIINGYIATSNGGMTIVDNIFELSSTVSTVTYITNTLDSLDVSQDIVIPLNYVIDDIRDPTKKNSNYSKSIRIPGTKTNNKLFGGLFDINSDFTYFNAFKKTTARLVIDDTTVMDGVLQLIEIIKNNSVDYEGNEIYYKVVLFENKIDLFSKIGEKLLTDLDMSEFDHTLTYTNISDTWTNVWTDGYVYPMMYNGRIDLTYGYGEWNPSIFHKQYLKKIVEEAGYQIGGSFYDDNSYYDKEIIPYNGVDPSVNTAELKRREFSVGYLADPTDILDWEHTVFGQELLGTNNPSGNQFLNVADLTPDLENTGTFFDPYNIWKIEGIDPAPFNNWIVNGNGLYDLSIEMNLDVIMTVANSGTGNIWYSNKNINDPAPSAAEIAKDTPNYVVAVTAKLKRGTTAKITIGTSVISNEFALEKNSAFNIPAFTNASNSVTRRVKLAGLAFENLELLEGDQISLQMRVYQQSNKESFWYIETSAPLEPVSTTQVVDLTFDIKTNNLGETQFKNKAINATISKDDDVIIGDYIPKTVKQKELITDIIKRYNLYISVDEINDKKIIFETRDDFYSRGSTLDWTNKKDFNTNDNIKLLSELTSKEIYFTYTADDDDFNKNYTVSTTDIYGTKKIVYDTDFKSNKVDIKTPFSPTPITYGERFRRTIIPHINATAPKTKIRVLYWGGLKDVIGDNEEWIFQDESTQRTHTTYPYSGHWDDYTSDGMTIDINFGSNDFYYIDDLTSVTNNNLYNRYWKNYINQVADGKMITSKFDLTEVDIGHIRNNMNSKIFVKDSYYYINKIKDYNPNIDLTEVELIKITPFISFEPELVTIEATPSSVLDGIPTPLPGTRKPLVEPKIELDVFTGGRLGTASIVGSNKVSGSLVTGVAIDNQILSDSTIVTGSNNLVSSTSVETIIVGDRNLIDSNTTKVGILGGDDNTIYASVENSWIIGSSDKVISQSNEIWIGDSIHIVDGALISTYNLLEGGNGQLRDIFATSPENLIEGGKDELRAQFPTNNINLIQG